MIEELNERAELAEEVAEAFGEHPRAQVYWELAAALRWDAEEIGGIS